MSLKKLLNKMEHNFAFYKSGSGSAPAPPPPPAPPASRTSPILGEAEAEDIDRLERLRGRKSTILTNRLFTTGANNLNSLLGE